MKILNSFNNTSYINFNGILKKKEKPLKSEYLSEIEIIQNKLQEYGISEYFSCFLANNTTNEEINFLLQILKNKKMNFECIIKFLELTRNNTNKDMKNEITELFNEELLNERTVYTIAKYKNKDCFLNSDFYNKNQSSLMKIKEYISENYYDYKKDNEIITKCNGFEYLIEKNLFDNNYYTPLKYTNREKIAIIDQLTDSKKILTEKEIKELNINSTISDLQKELLQSINIIDVSKEDIENFCHKFLANNEKINNRIINFDYSLYKESGLPLKYSRNDFIDDLNNCLKDTKEIQKADILQKLEISAKIQNDKITDFNGFINTNKLNRNNTIEKNITDICKKFLLNNEIQTNNKDFNETANALIKAFPEFINIIGKNINNQTVDVHLFNTLAACLNNENYSKLDNTEKTVLKFVAIFHDISKNSKQGDYSHAKQSSKVAKNILYKLKFENNLKNEIINLIENHHWLECYQNGSQSAFETAFALKNSGAMKIAKILTSAHLNTETEINNFNTNATEIEKNIDKINETGQIIFTNTIVNPKLVPKTEINGKTYKVINFKDYTDKEDLSKIGFTPNTTKKDLNFFIHATDNAHDLQRIVSSIKYGEKPFLSASFVDLENKNTFLRYKFGVGFKVLNQNIANADEEMQVSGREKNIDNYKKIVEENRYRNFVPDKIKSKISLSEKEYINLYQKMSKLYSLSQIKQDMLKNLSGKNSDIKTVKNAIINANKKLIYPYFGIVNEVCVYAPQVNFMFALVDDIKEIEQEFLDFAYSNDLPILILGKNIPKY